MISFKREKTENRAQEHRKKLHTTQTLRKLTDVIARGLPDRFSILLLLIVYICKTILTALDNSA